MRKLIQRYELRAKVKRLDDTNEVLLVYQLAQTLAKVRRDRPPPQTWNDEKGRRWEIWDKETAAEWQ
jgi:hypothetical protein